MSKILTRKNNRLRNYNYSDNGWYFVTICSRGRKNIFVEINNKYVGEGLAPSRDNTPVQYKDNIKLSKIGKIIDKQWNDIPNQYDNIELDEYIIMPNHIHGIMIVDNQVELREGASPSPTICDVIRSFKSKSSLEYLKYIKQNNLDISGKIWQRSFYDHIIRNERSLDAVREYISNNPENWEQDIENLLNL
ncbi:MAG: transposase [Candidatus Aenigmarchaeota archaeon]|nr:transposase [Candidatus Aenigmarchaeota archaeon]